MFGFFFQTWRHSVFRETGGARDKTGYMKVPGDSLESPDQLSCFVVPPQRGGMDIILFSFPLQPYLNAASI
ncbi:MAG: hypothetical protein D3910_16090 [Candidatus Electrothrix sp. ATG2]|nr:hypothetical protein [Candidatus Electrothrix sp. ATG2]